MCMATYLWWLEWIFQWEMDIKEEDTALID